ncbi:MAG: 50S ribosomal protein L11 methyltransferase [Ignavibacteriae bacterium]|nr:50S ribosomal protein L11 methyltransferase [Ignavibacteriota bacterium]
MPKIYSEIEIAADEQLREQLVGILSQLGFEGFWEEGSALRCYIPQVKWSEELSDEIRRVIRMVQRSSSSVDPVIFVRSVEEKNWNAEWEKTIRPIHVTDRIVITPTWHAYEAQPGELVLTIDPKMSFGTGYHETTRLVLRLMENYIRPGMRLLDIGTGTGVLAIAGVKLGAHSALGVDNDEWSHENGIENARLNGVEQQVSIQLGELADVPPGTFDMIVANIQRNVIEPLLPEMKSRLNPNGVVILSGLLDVDEQPIRKAVQGSGFNVQDMMRENEWIAFALHSERSAAK